MAGVEQYKDVEVPAAPGGHRRGIPPWGGLLEIEAARTGRVPGVSLRVILRDPVGTVMVGVVDALWTSDGAEVEHRAVGTVELDGVATFVALLGGTVRLRDCVLDGSARGDMVGLSQLTFVLERADVQQFRAAHGFFLQEAERLAREIADRCSGTSAGT